MAVLLGRVGRLEEVPDAAGEVALEVADGVAVGLAFCVLARDVVLRLRVAAGASYLGYDYFQRALARMGMIDPASASRAWKYAIESMIRSARSSMFPTPLAAPREQVADARPAPALEHRRGVDLRTRRAGRELLRVVASGHGRRPGALRARRRLPRTDYVTDDERGGQRDRRPLRRDPNGKSLRGLVDVTSGTGVGSN